MLTHSSNDLQCIGLIPELLKEDIKLVEQTGPLRQCASMQDLMGEAED